MFGLGRNEFESLQCDYKVMTDYVGALNIRDRVGAAVKQPIVTPLFSIVTSHHALAGGN
jgi:hypothetical protein